MRFKKTIVFSIIILIIYLTYLFFNDGKLNYVALGDSLASGQTPYGEDVGYGYADYIKDYLEENNRLGEYTKNFASSGYTVSDILSDLENNKRLVVDNKEINLRKQLRESDIVTISVGANDFMKGLSLNNLDLDNPIIYKEKIDTIMEDISILLKEVRKYAKKEVIVIGYYNPFPILTSKYGRQLDDIFNYIDNMYINICSKNSVSYLSIYSIFKENNSFLPNPFDIHPNLKGYEAISNLIIGKYLST